MNDLSISKFSKYQCGFGEVFDTKQCLLLMIEDLRKIQYNKEVFTTMFIDL